MEPRSSSRTTHRMNAHVPSHCHLENSRRPGNVEELSRNYSVQNRNINWSKSSLDGCYLAPYRKSMPSRPVRKEAQNSELLQRRGSVYQSSQEVRRSKIFQDHGRNVESTSACESFLSFDIVGSSTLCNKNDDERDNQRQKCSPASSQVVLTSSSSNPAQLAHRNSSEFLDLSFRVLLEEPADDPIVERRDTRLDDILGITLSSDNNCPHGVVTSVAQVSSRTSRCKDVEISGNTSIPVRRDKMQILPKSFSVKVAGVGLENSVYPGTSKIPTKTRFSPFTRMLDPLVKSKSVHNQPLAGVENGCGQSVDLENFRTLPAETSCRTGGLKMTSATEKIDRKEPLIRSVEEVAVLSSPVHLNATLKLENRHKAFSFLFSLSGSDDVFYSKTWRTDNPFDWVYTFYSNKRKNCMTTRDMRENQKQGSLMIGQMQVSCYLCSEVGSTGSMDKYTIMEFMLYDISQLRRISVTEGRNCNVVDTQCQTGNMSQNMQAIDAKELDAPLHSMKAGHQYRQASGDCNSDNTDSHPLFPSDLLPNMESAAIVIQIPFDDREKLKDANGCHLFPIRNLNNQNGFSMHHGNSTLPNYLHPVSMKVITPSGRHGLPNTEGCPSPLLYRWRSGGRCDCGGWDMGCPITVLAANCTDHSAEFSLKKCRQSLRLDVEGSKDVMPALLIKMSAEGEYCVTFHAQLSALQAFTISVAVVHLLEYFRPDCGQNIPILHSNSLKQLLEEELRQLLEAVAEEEKRKVKKRVVRPTPLYCLLDPPFSPMSRV